MTSLSVSLGPVSSLLSPPLLRRRSPSSSTTSPKGRMPSPVRLRPPWAGFAAVHRAKSIFLRVWGSQVGESREAPLRPFRILPRISRGLPAPRSSSFEGLPGGGSSRPPPTEVLLEISGGRRSGTQVGVHRARAWSTAFPQRGVPGSTPGDLRHEAPPWWEGPVILDGIGALKSESPGGRRFCPSELVPRIS